MNNNKIISTAKKLDLFSNVLSKVTFGLGIACVVISFFILLFGKKMFSEEAYGLTLVLDFIELQLDLHSVENQNLMGFYLFSLTLGSGIFCFLVYYLAKQFCQILTPMKSGRPFESGMADQVKKMGWLILIGGFLCELIDIISQILLLKVYPLHDLFISDAITNTEVVLTINFNFVLISGLIFFLSYIFAYGQMLQQDSDETL